ncbi:MAG TPA: hypothetical protein DDX19_12510 [Rhodopirellula baltica]|nr:hypothetical protein [Rhodopirellula baltica]
MISKPTGLGRWHHCPQQITRIEPTVGDAGRDKSLWSVFLCRIATFAKSAIREKPGDDGKLAV